MFNYESFRFMFVVFLGNWLIFVTVFHMWDMTLGPVRKERINGPFFTIVFIIYIFVFRLDLRELDFPGFLVPVHGEMEGTVCDFWAEREDGQGKADMTGGTVDIIDDETGNIVHFRDVRVPSELSIDDKVRMLYLKNYRMGAVVEINGKKTWYHIDNDKPLGVVMILFALVSVPFYYLWRMRIKPFFHYQRDYTVYAYRDLYIRSMKVLYFIMLLWSAVLLTAVLGYYGTSWDALWGMVLAAGYLGMFGVSYMQQKRFVILDGKFYYCGIKKWYEGDLTEIGRVEKTDKGIVIYAGEKEMEILCSSEKYLEPLLKRLPVRIQEGSGD